MTTPQFLIIGSMKSGSTTLFRDLETHPRIFFPMDKEPESLCHDAVLGAEGRATYERLFKSAKADQVCAEASTGYMKRPTFEGMASRAFEVLGADARIIALVREPVARVISQHHHELSDGGQSDRDINQAVIDQPHMIAYSKYAMQIEPWIEAFGADHVRIIRFEDYIADRVAHAAAIQTFLGLEAMPELVDAGAQFNVSSEKRVASGKWKNVVNSRAYRKWVRPWLPMGLKDAIRNRILPKAVSRPAPPTLETVRLIQDAVRADHERLAQLMGITGPVWDESKVQRKYGAG